MTGTEDDATISLAGRDSRSAARNDDAAQLRRWLRTRLLVESRDTDSSNDAVQLSLRRLQRRPSKPRRPLLLDARDHLLAALPIRRSDPEQADSGIADDLAAFDLALSTLGPTDRDLLVLAVEFGFDDEQLARECQLSQPDLALRLGRAALALAAAMP